MIVVREAAKVKSPCSKVSAGYLKKNLNSQPIPTHSAPFYWRHVCGSIGPFFKSCHCCWRARVKFARQSGEPPGTEAHAPRRSDVDAAGYSGKHMSPARGGGCRSDRSFFTIAPPLPRRARGSGGAMLAFRSKLRPAA